MKWCLLIFPVLIAVAVADLPVRPFNRPTVQGPVASVIVNGKFATKNQFPYHVVIRIAESKDSTEYLSMCGASFIHAKYVLTAGHCVYGFAKFLVGFGALQWTSPLRKIVSTKFYLHPSYNVSTLNNDLAIIELSTVILSTTSYKIIRLPSLTQKKSTFEGFTARVSGFGLTSDYSAVSASLKWVDLTIITNTVCKVTYGDYIFPTTLCAYGAKNQSTCFGDSGGPLAINECGIWTLVGVVSFVSSVHGCEAGTPSGYIRVASYLDWIKSVTQILLRP